MKFLKSLLNLCPYTYLWRAVKTALKERRLPESARSGAFITVLGLCCPIFWTAYFRGANRSELLFHAVHSGFFIFIGMAMMLAGMVKK